MKHKKILIIQTAFLGDVILSTPLIKVTRGLFPHSFISFLLIPETRRVLENNPHLDQVLVYDKRKKRGIASFIHTLSKIKEGNFDLALVPHRSLRSALLAYLSRIPERIGFDKSAGSFLLTRKVTYRSDIHEVDRNLSLLSDCGSDLENRTPELFPSPDDFAHVRKLLENSGVGGDDRLVAVAPGSVWATKRWLPEGFAKVSQLLMERSGIRVVFLGSEEDRPLCEEIAGLMPARPIILAGETDILQTAAAVSLCKALVSNDSAPVHIASAVKTPVVAIFGSTVPGFGFAPYGVSHAAVEKEIYCRPCGIHGKRRCPEKHFRCMKDITPGEVFQAVASLL